MQAWRCALHHPTSRATLLCFLVPIALLTIGTRTSLGNKALGQSFLRNNAGKGVMVAQGLSSQEEPHDRTTDQLSMWTRESSSAAKLQRVPNELGRFPILEWHQVGDTDGTYRVSRERFRAELEELYRRDYVPVNMSEILDGTFSVPAGKTPVLLTFDDSSPSQFRYIESYGQLVVDPTSAVGILLDFIRTRPEWKPRAIFCVLPAASSGHAFFGDKGIDGQLTAWRFPKLRFLVQQGFELCNHTLWHARLDRYTDAVVQEQLARGAMAIDSAIPGYRVRVMSLPYGIWPKTRELAFSGSWYDPKSERVVTYRHEAVFEVTGGPARSPYDPAFNRQVLPRVSLQGGTKLSTTLDLLDKPGPMARFVSDGDPTTIARPQP